jgi:hypothetical protein
VSIGLALLAVSREDILRAIREYSSGAIEHSYRPSRQYDLVWEGERYPPVAIAGLAVRPHLGRLPMARLEIRGGIDTNTFRVLSREGFQIVTKNGEPISGPNEEAIAAAAAAAQESLGRKQGQGYSQDPAARRAIERHAMDRAELWYARRGYTVDATVASSHSYDLRCTRNREILLVEVKGTTSSGEQFFLTANEVRLAQSGAHEMALFICYDIRLSHSGGNWAAVGGQDRVINPWKAPREHLTPLVYRFDVPADAS